MTIADFLSDINNVDSIGVPTQRASTPEELYQNCIALALKEEKEITDAIIEWHKLLMRYINNVKNGAVLLSRLYESLKVDDQWANRRGCLTLAKNYNYAFASNHFARVIFTMAINKFVPTDEDFWDMIVNRKISLSSYLGQTQQAKRISAYPNKSYNIKYYTPGWYLAHVIPVNNHAYQGYENINVYDIYKHGEESEWQYDCALNCMVRKTDDCIDSDKMKVAKAHFLRFLDPINYFLVPGQRHVIYKQIKKGDGWPIGENKYIVDLMTIKAHDRFGKYFEEFLKVALVEDDYIEKVMPDIKEAAEKIEETEKDCGTCTSACKKHIG